MREKILKFVVAIAFVAVAWHFGRWYGLGAIGWVVVLVLERWPRLKWVQSTIAMVLSVAIWVLAITAVRPVAGAIWHLLGWWTLGVIPLGVVVVCLIAAFLPSSGSGVEIDGGAPSPYPPDYGFPDTGPSPYDAGDMTAG